MNITPNLVTDALELARPDVQATLRKLGAIHGWDFVIVLVSITGIKEEIPAFKISTNSSEYEQPGEYRKLPSIIKAAKKYLNEVVYKRKHLENAATPAYRRRVDDNWPFCAGGINEFGRMISVAGASYLINEHIARIISLKIALLQDDESDRAIQHRWLKN